MSDMRGKKHRVGCPTKEEILEAYEKGLATREYTKEWLEAIGEGEKEDE